MLIFSINYVKIKEKEREGGGIMNKICSFFLSVIMVLGFAFPTTKGMKNIINDILAMREKTIVLIREAGNR